MRLGSLFGCQAYWAPGGPAEELRSVTTSIEINADASTVWKNVISFPQLAEPSEFIFRSGITYPINAQINGQGVGAIRHCNFSTGSFIEPISVWEEGKLLKFDVDSQPEPLKELILYLYHFKIKSVILVTYQFLSSFQLLPGLFFMT